MYLDQSPVYFTKDGRRKAVYHTVLARELLATGWQQEGAVAPEAPPQPIAPVVEEVAQPEALAEAADAEEEPEPGEYFDLDSMTKMQLVSFAEVHDIEFKSSMSKAELLEICKEAVNG